MAGSALSPRSRRVSSSFGERNSSRFGVLLRTLPVTASTTTVWELSLSVTVTW
ncbi:hypothetical protein LT493_42535 [Streptomyces tricolor]|nr:hypothetical protein [Streptomyces tricolor]